MRKSPIRLLALDDDQTILGLLEESFRPPGYEFQAATDGAEAMELLKGKEFDVVLLDLNMPEMHGIDVLGKIREEKIPVEVIVLTGHATVSSAVDAMKLGAYDFLTKPIRIAELTATIEKAREKKLLLRENELLRREIHRKAGEGHIITGSPLMRALLDDVSRVAGSDFPVLVSGETGVGKELVAREVHRRSGRSEEPFIPINCGALPETMLESELFGFEKGAFTGAHGRKAGLLEVAEGGSLFLDEVGEMPPALQGKLLRAVESGSFFRLGGTREIKVDVRYVAATNRNLAKAVDDGTFRMDLYYRINALPLNVPPLRERREDIPLLVQHFIESTPAFRDRKIAPEAIARLREYSWPGNVRELQNIVHRLLLLSEGDIVAEADIAGMLSPRPSSRGRRLQEVEREHILRVLTDTGGHRRRAAEILGVDPKTLYRKMKEYDDQS